MGDNIKMYGTKRSFNFIFVNRPSAKIPNSGPQVYPAMVKIASMTFVLLMARNIKITTNIMHENIR